MRKKTTKMPAILYGDAGTKMYKVEVRENNRRYFEPLNNYCYEYPVPDSIGRSFVIDATQGNLTRFINHSYEPNLKPKYAFLKGVCVTVRSSAADFSS